MSKSHLSAPISRGIQLPRGWPLLGVLACLCVTPALMAAEGPAPSGLSAAQIADRNVAARGGLSAWRALQTLSVTGKMEAGSGDSAARSARLARAGLGVSVKHAVPKDDGAAAANTQVQLPFTLEMKRPDKSRLEIQFAGKTAVQVYDGTNGWKVRPFLNRSEVEPFTAEEAKAESGKDDMDGLLINYQARGAKVELAGTEAVEGHSAYKLKVTSKSGEVRNVWVDSKTFLDVKVEGVPRRMDGRVHRVWVYQRDFKPVQGLMMPYVYETVVEGFPQAHRMIVDSITVNQALSDARFGKPQLLAANVPAAAALPAAIPVVKK